MRRIVIAVVLGMVCAGVANADVRTDEKTQVKFEGMLGRMANLFGGRAAKEGLVSTVSVKGDRKATLNGETGQIIDLNERVADGQRRRCCHPGGIQGQAVGRSTVSSLRSSATTSLFQPKTAD